MVEAGGVDHVEREAMVRDSAEHPCVAPGAEEHLGRRQVSASCPEELPVCPSHLLHLGAKRGIPREGAGVQINRTAHGGFCKVPTAAEWPHLRRAKLSRNCRTSSIALNLKCYLLRNAVGKVFRVDHWLT